MEADGVKAVQWDQIIMRRIDAENKLADLEIEKWAAEEESTEDEGGRGRNGLESEGVPNMERAQKDDIVGGEDVEEERKRKRVKEVTREELWRLKQERDEVGKSKKAKMEAKRMVKRGTMKKIEYYFK